MREKLGFFRKQFLDTGSLATTSIVPSIKGGVANSGCMLQLQRVWKTTGGPPTKEQIISWSHSFEDLLFDRHGISLFLEFLRSEFSEENLEFWSECQSYRSIGCPKKLQEKATQIYEDYVAEQSPREINIDSVTRIQTSLEIPHATVNTFDQSQKKIQALMEKDSYQRFLRSDIYHGLIIQLNAAPHIYGNVGQYNPVTAVEQTSARVSYIPGLLPNVTAGIKTHPLHSSTNSRILSINIKESHRDDVVPNQSHHRSAPSSPKNVTASTIP